MHLVKWTEMNIHDLYTYTWIVTQSAIYSRPITSINPLTAILKPHSNGPLYSNSVIGTLAVDGWGQCTNFILFDVAL